MGKVLIQGVWDLYSCSFWDQKAWNYSSTSPTFTATLKKILEWLQGNSRLGLVGSPVAPCGDKTPFMWTEGTRAAACSLTAKLGSPLCWSWWYHNIQLSKDGLGSNIGRGIKPNSFELKIFCLKFTARNIKTSFWETDFEPCYCL